MSFNERCKIREILSCFTFKFHQNYPSKPTIIIYKSKKVFMSINGGGRIRTSYVSMHKIKKIRRISSNNRVGESLMIIKMESIIRATFIKGNKGELGRNTLVNRVRNVC